MDQVGFGVEQGHSHRVGLDQFADLIPYQINDAVKIQLPDQALTDNVERGQFGYLSLAFSPFSWLQADIGLPLDIAIPISDISVMTETTNIDENLLEGRGLKSVTLGPEYSRVLGYILVRGE